MIHSSALHSARGASLLERGSLERGLLERDPDALIPYLESRMRTPFAWGWRANDCASFADGGVRAMTGRSVIRELGVAWTTALGAARVMKRLAGWPPPWTAAVRAWPRPWPGAATWAWCWARTVRCWC